MRGLRSVILIGGGEPTLYPKFGDVVRLLKSGGVGVAVVSNGSRNHVIEEVADAFTQGDWVRYSLDSGTDQTFQDMHKPKRPITLEEICAGVPAIKAKSPVLTVGFSYIIVWKGAEREEGIDVIPNIDEIVTATRLARDNGFNYISFKPFLTRHPEGSEVMDPEVIENFNDTIRRITEGMAEAKTFETPTFKVMESTNLRVLLAGTWRDFTHQPKMCHMMAMRQVVSPLGVYNCPAHRGLSKARLGNRDSFATEELRQETNATLAGMLDSFDASHECSAVTCLYNSANWWLERMVEGTLTPEEQTALPDTGDYYL